MVGSEDSLDFCTDVPVTEKNAIPLDCWQNIRLSNIFIPSRLLPNRSKASDKRVTQGIYHTLEKKDPSRYTKSFSVYSDAQSEQGEIFLSDSDEDIFGSDISVEKIETLSDNTLVIGGTKSAAVSDACSNDILNENFNGKDENLDPKENLTVNAGNSSYLDETYSNEKGKDREVLNCEENFISSRGNKYKYDNVSVKSLSKSDVIKSQENCSPRKESYEVKIKDFKDGDTQPSNKGNNDTDSLISLNEILDVTPEINIKDFAYDFKKYGNSAFLSTDYKQDSNPKKNKKVKKKPSKYITLDKFLEDSEYSSQDYYCAKYFRDIQHDNFLSTNIPIGSKAEFPDLTPEIKFIHSDETANEKDVELSFKYLTSDLIKCDAIKKNENIDAEEIKSSMTDIEKYGKIVIENIPCGVSEDDISLLLCGYGEIKNFSLISAGNFLKAYVEIDLICDIDWIIECLNGTDPFGASSEMIKCYKQQ